MKATLFCLWLTLFVLLLQRDYFVKPLENRESIALARDARSEFQAVYFKNNKIGYVETEYLPAENGVVIKQHAKMHLTVSNETLPLELSLEAVVSTDSSLKQFEFTFESRFYRMKASGTVAGNTISFSLDTGNNYIQDELSMDTPPLLSTSRKRFLLMEEMEIGDKVRVPWFDPVSLSPKNSTIEYRGKEQVLIRERVYHLHRFTEHFAGTRVNSWLDDDGNVIKEESPAGFVFIREPEYKAKKIEDSSEDLLASVAAELKGTLPDDFAALSSIQYRLLLPPENTFNLNTGRQQFSENILTIRREQFTDLHSVAELQCRVGSDHLSASPYIQTDAEDIVTLSNQLTNDLASSYEIVSTLAEWVFAHIEKRPVIGIPDALTTLKNRLGDCNEHASLFAALSRAAGIPTKIAAGVVFHNGAFYYHAWNEVCLEGSWISLDTTTMQFPADLSHIKFVEGGFKEQIKIGALLGTLEIEILSHEK